MSEEHTEEIEQIEEPEQVEEILEAPVPEGPIYIAGRILSNGLVTWQPGDVIPNAEEEFKYIEAFINTGNIYRVYNDDLSDLPPYLVPLVVDRASVLEAISAAETPPTGLEWSKPETVVEAEKLAEIQAQVYEMQQMNATDMLVRRKAAAVAIDNRPVENRIKPPVEHVDSMKAEAQSRASASVTDNYDSIPKPELVSLSQQRGLSSEGTKADLIDRLRQQDAEV